MTLQLPGGSGDSERPVRPGARFAGRRCPAGGDWPRRGPVALVARVVPLVGDLGSGGAPAPGRTGVRPARSRAALSAGPVPAQSGRSHRRCGARPARGPQSGRSLDRRPPGVRRGLSRGHGDPHRRLGRAGRDRPHADGPGRSRLVAADRRRRHLRRQLADPADGRSPSPKSAATRDRRIGVLVPILAGGFVLARLREGIVGRRRDSCGRSLRGHHGAGGARLAAADARRRPRRRSACSRVAALLLVGGVADALSLSALFGGLVAGRVLAVRRRRRRATRSAATCSSCSTRCSCWCCWWPARAPSTRSTSLALGAGLPGAARCSASWPAATLAARVVGADAPGDLAATCSRPACSAWRSR